jgi:hypothetical protein
MGAVLFGYQSFWAWASPVEVRPCAAAIAAAVCLLCWVLSHAFRRTPHRF